MLILLLALCSWGAISFAVQTSCSLADRDRCRENSNHNAGPLILYVKVEDNLADPRHLVVYTSLINTSEKPIKLIKDPNSLLIPQRTYNFNFFKIPDSSINTSNITCVGATLVADVDPVDYDPEAVDPSDPRAYILLRPRQKRIVKHDLAGMYSFPEPGLYFVRIASDAKDFAFIEDNGTIAYTQAKLYDGPHADTWETIRVEKSAVYSSMTRIYNRAAPDDSLELSKRSDIIFRDCNHRQQRRIMGAVYKAEQYIVGAIQYLDDATLFYRRRYTWWFGHADRDRHQFVRENFRMVRGKPFQYRYDCSCKKCGRSAFSDPTEHYTIHLCTRFWWMLRGGPNSQAGAIIREAMSLELSYMKEYTHGRINTHNFAKRAPKLAVVNADAYRYFAEKTRWIFPPWS